jgi:hypothetical protein
VIELRFHRELYDGNAVDEAMKVFGAHATFEQAEEPKHWIVRVTGSDVAREKRIAGELANYALGLTITRAGSSDSPSKSREAT